MRVMCYFVIRVIIINIKIEMLTKSKDPEEIQKKKILDLDLVFNPGGSTLGFSFNSIFNCVLMVLILVGF